MYRVQKNFADLEESSDQWSISTATVFRPTNDNQDGLDTKPPCCSDCAKKGMGDLPTVFSTGDITQLFVDPTTGGFSWTTAAVLGGAAILALMLFSGKGKGLGKLNLFGSPSAKDKALASARSAYQAQRKQIEQDFK
jgi:hypothetical protein